MVPRFPASAIGSQPAVYRVRDWHIAARDPQSIAFRPSLKTLFPRLRVTAIAAMIIVLAAGIREVSGEVGTLSGTSAAVVRGMNTGFWILSGIVAAIGVLSPVAPYGKR